MFSIRPLTGKSTIAAYLIVFMAVSVSQASIVYVDTNDDMVPDEFALDGAILTLGPQYASGEEYLDWIIGPDPSVITLFGQDQLVRFDVFVEDFGPQNIAAIQYILSCDLQAETGDSGIYYAWHEECSEVVPSGSFCTGIDETRDDFLFRDVPSYFPYRDAHNYCPGSIPGWSAVSLVAIVGDAEDVGLVEYFGTFAIEMSSDARGDFVVGSDPDPNHTFIKDGMAEDIQIGLMWPAFVHAQPNPAYPRGSRYVSVRPPGGESPVSILVTGDPDEAEVACVSRYVQLDGSLGDEAVMQAPEQWGIVHVRGREIIPDKTYRVQFDDGQALSEAYAITMGRFADLDNNGGVNFSDIFLVVRAFQSGQTGPWIVLADIEPCEPNSRTNFADILRTVLVFQGGEFSDMNCPPLCEP
ncbi:MAG: hypothetical protein ACYTHJ_11110 [Planctomycetota bacterium]|jgi:hypothetical protein